MSSEPVADPRWKRAVDMLAVIGPPLTISTALLVYFGWARTDAQAKAMGLDLPITEQVYEVLYEGKHPREAVDELMLRSLKGERWPS